MSGHLPSSTLNALVDGELLADELASANQHLAGCPSCTSSALHQSLLKSATAKAGQRYRPPPELDARLAAQVKSAWEAPALPSAQAPPARSRWGFDSPGWIVAAVFLVISATMMLVQGINRKAQIASAEQAALVTEVFDQHIATIAASSSPQVVSTDRHTVKPWFQGKIPFSFNLPPSLPAGATLDGANLTYLKNQPVAQLLYSIGQHRVSVFVRQRRGEASAKQATTQHSGFQVMEFSTPDLEVTAVSDVDPARLAELVSAIRQAQAQTR